MDTDALRIFVEVARRGSFAAVARDRETAASHMSRAVAALEQELGFRLFQRTTRRMSLTEAGARYLGRVEVLIEELEGARDSARAISAAPAGTLRLTASVAFGTKRIMPLLGGFREECPDVQVELVLTDATLDLVAERIDLAVRLGPSTHADMISSKLVDTRYRVCAAHAWVAKHGMPVRPADLARHDCLLFDLPDFRSRWQFRLGKGPEELVPVHGSLIASSPLALLEGAIAGLGPTLLPSWLLEPEFAAGRLIDLYPRHQVAATRFDTAAWIIYPSRAFLPAKVRHMIDFLRRNISA